MNIDKDYGNKVDECLIYAINKDIEQLNTAILELKNIGENLINNRPGPVNDITNNTINEIFAKIIEECDDNDYNVVDNFVYNYKNILDFNKALSRTRNNKNKKEIYDLLSCF